MVNYKKAQKLYKKSVEVLKSVQLKNGGILATPKGERYPYVYPRDHAIGLLGFLSAGFKKEVKKGIEFIFKAQGKSGAFPQRVDCAGKDASYKPIQIDGTGLNLYVFSRYVKKHQDAEFFNRYSEQAKKAVAYILKNIEPDKDLVYTPNSIHEFPPIEQGLEIWANAVCCAALREMDCFLDSERIKRGILKFMWNSRIQGFIKTIRLKESSSVVTAADASVLGLAEFGVIDDRDEFFLKSVKRIEKNLWHSKLGGLCRYEKYYERNNGGYGPWPHFTLMLARHYIRVKNKKNVDRCLNWVLNTAYRNLLPEHIAPVEEFEEYVQDFKEAGILRKDRLTMIENARKHPMFKKGLAYITLPLTWPHAEFIITWNLYQKTFNVRH